MLKDAQLQTVVPLNYGAMPDLGRYSQPDGPGAELVGAACRWARSTRRAPPRRRRSTHLEHDMWCVVEAMIAAGVDGLDFDTAGAAGDADLLATLRVVRQLRDT